MKTIELILLNSSFCPSNNMSEFSSKIRKFLSSRYFLVFALAFVLAVSDGAANAQSYEEANGLSQSPSMQVLGQDSGSVENKQEIQEEVVEEDEEWDEEEDWDEEEGSAKSFLFLEMVSSFLYSYEGVTGIPIGDPNVDHFEISPRPPGNYIGFDYIKYFDSFPRWFPLTTMDLHPRLVYNSMESGDALERLSFAPQDFWLRFNPGGSDRLSLRVGQFTLPYGANPVVAVRQRFILPLEATDLGLKWDWGVSLKGPIGEYDWEIAVTMGSGEAIHTPHLKPNSENGSYLYTGRIGTPTYWDFQHGLSFLLGDLSTIRSTLKINEDAVSRWRVGYDVFNKRGTWLLLAGQLTFGQDGFTGDSDFIRLSMGEKLNVLGVRAMVDYIIPQFQNIRLASQFEWVYKTLASPRLYDTTEMGYKFQERSKWEDTALLFEIGYSFSTAITAKFDYRYEMDKSMGWNDHALFLTFILYARI